MYTPIRRDENHDPTICCLHENYFKSKTHRLKLKEREKILHAKKLDGYNVRNKQTLSQKQSQETNKDILIKGSIHQEEIAIINIYTPRGPQNI